MRTDFAALAVRPIEEASYWLATRQKKSPPSLHHPDDCDIAVVGAGFTGLWTAHFIKALAPETRITILEQKQTGYGGTGRNAGMVSNCIDHNHQLAQKHFGQAQAARLAQIGLANIDELAAYATDCDFVRSGQLQMALNETHLEDNIQTLAAASQLGIDGYRCLDQAQTRQRLDSPLYKGSLYVPGGGIINPISLVDRLQTDLQAVGVDIREGTPVKSIQKTTGGARLILDNKQIDCKRVVLATDAYSHHLLPGLLHRFVPLYDYIIVSQPLLPEQKKQLGWQNKEGIMDGRTFFNYYRLLKDDRILWGTSDASYYGNRVDAAFDHSMRHYRELQESFDRHFPQIQTTFDYAWGGPIASTTRLTPFFGHQLDGRLLYALGYTGHGIGSTRVAGKILAHMALDAKSELLDLDLAKKKPMPYPPEPLRSLAIKIVTSSLRKVDAGHKPNLVLFMLDRLGIGFSS